MIDLRENVSVAERLISLATEQDEVRRRLKGILLFVVLWPLIGGLVFIAGWAVVFPRSNFDLATFTRDLGITVMIAYMSGFFPAVMVGVAVVWLRDKWSSFNFLHVFCVGLAFGVLFALLRLDKGYEYWAGAERRADVVVKISACVVPTMVCWLILRRCQPKSE